MSLNAVVPALGGREERKKSIKSPDCHGAMVEDMEFISPAGLPWEMVVAIKAHLGYCVKKYGGSAVHGHRYYMVPLTIYSI